MEILSGLLLTNAIHQRFVPSIELPLFFYDKNNPHWIIYVSENRWYYVPKGHSALSKFENNEAVMFTVSEDPKVNGLPLVEMLIPFHISYYQRLLKNCDDDYLGELKKTKLKSS